MYIVVWEFVVRTECVTEFEAAYGPRGEWARLFAQSEGYRDTRLLRDTSNRLRYVTLDFWSSREAHEKFLRQHQKEYATLDERCQQLTSSEAQVGEFESSP
jgi:heme-degrading monooxygenase HmoA